MNASPSAPSAQTFLVVLALFVLVLLGGDYYCLTHPAAIAQVQTAQAQYTALTAKAQQATTPEARRQLRQEARTQAGNRLRGKFLLAAARFYNRAGAVVRLLPLLLAGAAVFFIKAPKEVPGQLRRKRPSATGARNIMVVGAVVALVGGYVLLTVPGYGVEFVSVAYPAAMGAVLFSGIVVGAQRAALKRPTFGLHTERTRQETADGLSLPTQDGGWINVPNPFRGTLVLGGAGAGKSYSIGEPLIEQFARKNFAGLIYDFKFPVLAEAAQKALFLAERRAEEERQRDVTLWGKLTRLRLGKPAAQAPTVAFHVINFRDLTRSERVNQLNAADMPVMAFAQEYARALINNLDPSSIRKMEFFATSAEALLTGIIWFYKKNFPAFCTIPHVVATALHRDYKHVLSMLETDIECGDAVRSITSAVLSGAEKQVAGVVGSLQNILPRINSPEVVWVLTPDAGKGEGFSLDLNDPDAPRLLCIGNDPSLKETFSPVVSCVIAVASKLMNQQKKHPSYVFLDEAATVYVPGLEVIPATARSNKVAMIYMTQDLSQMTDAYGKEKMQVMVSNLNNQFFGKVNSLETAKFISDLVGREEKEMVSLSTGNSQSGTGNNRSSNQSVSYQERNVVRVQDAIGLAQGEFIGQTVETEHTFFQGVITRPDVTEERFPLHPIASFGDAATSQENMRQLVQQNYERVRADVLRIIEQHPNTFAKEDTEE